MSSIYSIVEEIQNIFELFGYVTYDVVEWEKKKLIEQDDSDFPIIFIDENNETNDIENTTLGYLNEESAISINVVLATGKINWREDVNVVLRDIKSIIGTFVCNGDEWITWQYTGSQKHQLANTTSDAKIFGGVAINTVVNYEELEI